MSVPRTGKYTFTKVTNTYLQTQLIKGCNLLNWSFHKNYEIFTLLNNRLSFIFVSNMGSAPLTLGDLATI